MRKWQPRNLEFLKKRSVVDAANGCWLFQLKARSNKGYAQITVEGNKTRAVHRVAWAAAHGPIPAGMHVLHRCDVRHCCNPDHLFLGTNADNVADKVAKGRQSRQRMRCCSIRAALRPRACVASCVRRSTRGDM